jgi:hypothetical protein
VPSECGDPVAHDDEDHEHESRAMRCVESRVNGILAC